MADKITYGREEGGFAVYVNGKKQSVFRIKGWMNGLREWQGLSYTGSNKPKPNNFLRTQIEYHGKPQ
jgi:hypothetical protein